MPSVSNISFTVKFDLNSTPTLVLTDTSTIPNGAVGRFSITLPDNYTRTGSYTTPDITSSGGAFSYVLRLDSLGGVQKGQYTVKYEIQTTDTVVSVFTRQFNFDYSPVDIALVESFDVFTPSLYYSDATVYQRSGYNYSGLVRAWSVSSIPTGVITSSNTTIDLIKSGIYYDANYNVNFTASLTYTHQVYTWMTVVETINKIVNTYAETPPSLQSIVVNISALKTKLDSLNEGSYLYNETKESFQSSQTYFTHIIDKMKVGNTSSIYNDLKNLNLLLHNNQVTTYNPTNTQIYPYNLTTFFPGAAWGNVTGSITSQADLVAYVASQITTGSFSSNIGDGTSTQYTVTHSLNSANIAINLIENSTGNIAYADTTITGNNTISISFKHAPTSNQYKVIIKK